MRRLVQSVGPASRRRLWTRLWFFDLASCPDEGATIPPGAVQPNALLDNFEAMAFGPYLPGGRHALVLLSDDNLGANQTTHLVGVALPTKDLVGVN